MYFSYNGTSIYYEIHGNGIPIITLHGFPLDHQFMKCSFEPIFSKYPIKSFQRIYFDFPGMGMSTAGLSISTSQDIVEVSELFIDFLIKNQRFVIVGESYGAFIARALAMHRRFSILGMILVCPLTYPDDSLRTVSKIENLCKDQKFLSNLTSEEFEVLNDSLVFQTKDNWKRLQSEIMQPFMRNQTPWVENMRKKENYSLPYDVDAVDEPYDFPTLFLMGKQDNTVGYEDAWKIFKNYTHGSYMVINGAGHALEIDQADLYHHICAHWLKQLEFFKP